MGATVTRVTELGHYQGRLSRLKTEATGTNWLTITKKLEEAGPLQVRQGDEVQIESFFAEDKNKHYLTSLTVVGAAAGNNGGGHASQPAEAFYLDRDTIIARESAVKSAVEFLSHHEAWRQAMAKAKYAGVITYARRLEAYFLGRSALAAEGRSVEERLTRDDEMNFE